jgi:hypothetical protein
MRRRALVITDDAARHPFLASLPPHVRKTGEVRVIHRKKPTTSGNSIRDFLMNYCACFAAIAVFIA